MKNLIKFLCFSAFCCALTFGLMSTQTDKSEDTVAGYELYAYKNVIEYQNAPMSVFRTTKPPLQQVNALKSKSAGILKSNNLRPTNSTGRSIQFSQKDPSSFFEQDLDKGKISFSKGMQKYQGKNRLQLPDERKAESIARNFLKESNLLPKNVKELSLRHVGGMKGSTPNSKPVQLLRTITYGREINGIPVIGPSSKIVVNVGDQGEIVGASYQWKPIEMSKSRKVESAAMKTPKQAEMELNKKIARDFGKDARKRILKMHKAYYDGGDNYIQPAYFFETDITLASGTDNVSKFSYLGIIPALRNAPEPIMKEAPLPPEAAKSIRNMPSQLSNDVQQKMKMEKSRKMKANGDNIE